MTTVPAKTKYLNLNDPASFAFPDPTTLPSDLEIRLEVPTVETYIDLRKSSGLSPFKPDAAEKGLKGGLHSCLVFHRPSNKAIGMGRIVGDGGCFALIVDIAVLPEHQKKGLGKVIFETLLDWAKENLKGSFVSLLADGPAKQLYARYGFKETGPYSVGMGVLL